MAEMDDDELLDALGVEVAPLKASSRTPREERIIAGFEDILRFHQTHGRAPLHGEGRDIFERLYAVRLDQLRKLPEAQTLLAGLDGPGLLSGAAAAPADVDDLDEDALLAELGIGDEPADQNDITVLRHVRSSAEKRAAEEIADRTPCADFDKFQAAVRAGGAGSEVWRSENAALRDAMPALPVGNFFIVGGQLAYVAEIGEGIKAPNGETMHDCASSTPTARKATCCAAHYSGRSTRTRPGRRLIRHGRWGRCLAMRQNQTTLKPEPSMCCAACPAIHSSPSTAS